MTLTDSLLLSLVGITVVFFVLVLLMLIIRLIALFGRSEQRETATANLAAAPAADFCSHGELMLSGVDDKTAAMVMAIVADRLQAPLNELRFISIKEVTEQGNENEV